MPSFSNSPWILGAPQPTLASAIWRMSRLVSRETPPLDGLPARDFHRQNKGAARCASQVGQLLPKGKVLQCKVRTGAEGGTQGSKEAQDQGNHRAMMHDGCPIAASMAAPS